MNRRPPSPGTILNPHYQPTNKPSWKARIFRALAWGLIVATVSALVAGLTILTGGAILPAGVTILSFILQQAAIGLLEGVTYAFMVEFVNRIGANEVTQSIAAGGLSQSLERNDIRNENYVKEVTPEKMKAEMDTER